MFTRSVCVLWFLWYRAKRLPIGLHIYRKNTYFFLCEVRIDLKIKYGMLLALYKLKYLHKRDVNTSCYTWQTVQLPNFLINCASIHYCLQRLNISRTVLQYSRPFEKSLQSHHLFHFTHGHTLHTDFGSNNMLLRLYDTRRASTYFCFTPRKSNVQTSSIENMDNLPLLLD